MGYGAFYVICPRASSQYVNATADDWRIAFFLEISSTGWCTYDAPCWLSVRSGARSHSPHYSQFMVCRSLNACQLNECL